MSNSKEVPWTTGMTPVTVADADLPTDQSLGVAGLSGGFRRPFYGITVYPTTLFDDGIHDYPANLLGLGNIHNHGITDARSTLARETYSCPRIRDSIDGLHGMSCCLNGEDTPEEGDEFEGGWLTYAVPGVAVGVGVLLLLQMLKTSPHKD